MYDAVVVIGGNDNARLPVALACIKQGQAENLILAGALKTARMIAIQQGVPPERIKMVNSASFTAQNDVAQTVKIAKENNFKTLLVITEKPHWFRVKYFFEKMAPTDLIVRHGTSIPAPLWYWGKEFVGYTLMRIFPGHENSKLYKLIFNVWKKISPLRER